MTVMITRRTLCRINLLRPDTQLNNLYLYCLAVFSSRFSIDVHAFTLMSNHHHLVVTDTQGRMPDFLRELHRSIARGTKALRNWEGSVWDSDKTSVVELRTEEAVIERLAYCMANPVAAGAVRRARQWPGLNVLPEQLGRRTWTVKRPGFFFDADNPDWPEVATLRLTMAPSIISDARMRELVACELTRVETEAQLEMDAKGWRFLGPQRVLAASPYDCATSWEPLVKRNPTFAVGRGQREAFLEAVIVLREFRSAYRQALDAWCNGIRHALFPAGTWLMRCLHAVAVAPS
jgi:putative transposase